MLDGRYGRVLSGCVMALGLGVSACGSTDDVAASTTGDEATPSAVETPAEEPEELETPATTPPEAPEDDETTEPKEEPAASVSPCDGPNPSARCDADPDSFDEYGAASLISTFELVADQSCCVDFDDDGAPDNALGEGFAAVNKLEQLNAELRESILDGSQTILLELAGLDDLREDDAVDVHVWNGNQLGEMSEDLNLVELDQSSIDRGVAPLFSFDSASVEDGVLHASKGEMALEASFNGVLLKPRVHDVSVSARLSSDDPTTGVALRNGEVGGRVELREIYSQINAVAGACDCLDLDGPLVESNAQREIGICAEPDVSACEAAGREACVGLVEVCPVLDIVATNIADVDGDGDGIVDSISLGAFFEAERAVITGVTR